MKRFLLFLFTIFVFSNCFSQNNVYSVNDYSIYSDSLEYPICIPDGTTVIFEYVMTNDSCDAHLDTMFDAKSFNLRLYDVNSLVSFSIFNKSYLSGIETVNWICIHPEGNSNVLLIFDSTELYKKYRIYRHEYDCKLRRKGKIKNGVAVESLIGLENGNYVLELKSRNIEYVVVMQISVNQF